MEATSKYRTEQSDLSDPIVPNRTSLDHVPYGHTSIKRRYIGLRVFFPWYFKYLTQAPSWKVHFRLNHHHKKWIPSLIFKPQCNFYWSINRILTFKFGLLSGAVMLKRFYSRNRFSRLLRVQIWWYFGPVKNLMMNLKAPTPENGRVSMETCILSN